MPSAEKVERVTRLRERIQGSQAMFLADFRGLTVLDLTELREALRQSGAQFAVVKNTLMKRAAEEAGVSELSALLEGPTGVVFVVGDPVAAARGLADAGRRFRTLALKGGYMEGRVLSAADAMAVSTLEPRDVLLARVAGLAGAEMARALFVIRALQGRLLALLSALREKLSAGAGPPADQAGSGVAGEGPEASPPHEGDSEGAAPGSPGWGPPAAEEGKE